MVAEGGKQLIGLQSGIPLAAWHTTESRAILLQPLKWASRYLTQVAGDRKPP